MLTGHVPFSCQNVLQIFEAIVKGDYTIPGYVSTNASDLIRKMMQKDPKASLFVCLFIFKSPYQCLFLV